MTILALHPTVTVLDRPAPSAPTLPEVWPAPAVPRGLRQTMAAHGWKLMPAGDPRAEHARRYWRSATIAIFSRGERFRGYRITSDKRGRISVVEF